jgi:hypothetical protein
MYNKYNSNWDCFVYNKYKRNWDCF